MAHRAPGGARLRRCGVCAVPVGSACRCGPQQVRRFVHVLLQECPETRYTQRTCRRPLSAAAGSEHDLLHEVLDGVCPDGTDPLRAALVNDLLTFYHDPARLPVSPPQPAVVDAEEVAQPAAAEAAKVPEAPTEWTGNEADSKGRTGAGRDQELTEDGAGDDPQQDFAADGVFSDSLQWTEDRMLHPARPVQDYADAGQWTREDEAEEVMCEMWVLWIGSLPPRCCAADLIMACSAYGPIASAVVNSQQQNGVYSALGLVHFMHPDAAFAAYDRISEEEGMLGSPLNLRVKIRPPQAKWLAGPLWPVNIDAADPLAPGWQSWCSEMGWEQVADDERPPERAWTTQDCFDMHQWGQGADTASDRHELIQGVASSWAAKAAAARLILPPTDALGDDKRGSCGGALQGRIGEAMPVGQYFCNDLEHPSLAFSRCQEIGDSPQARQKLVDAVQTGWTMNRTEYVSFRGCPTWAVQLVLPDLLSRRRRRDSVDIVIVAGVGGQDGHSGKHKHRSHTKGGTIEALVQDLLLKSRDVDDSKSSVRPLFTLGPSGDGGKKIKYYGSFLVRLARL